MLEAVLYAFQDASDEPDYTIDQQLRLCEVAWKSEPGPVIARLHDDEKSRPQLRKARDLCRMRKACLIVHSLDRLGPFRAVIKVASGLLHGNCHLIAVLDRLDTIESPPRDALRAIVTIGQIQQPRVPNKYWLTTARRKDWIPFGWRWSPTKRRLMPIKKLQAQRARIIELNAGGMLQTDVAKLLAFEYPRPGGWSRNDVNAILLMEERIEGHKAIGRYEPPEQP